MHEIMLLATLLCSVFMTGLIWFVQIVHYPLMASIGTPESSQYAVLHQQRTTAVVGPVMLVEIATAAIASLLWFGAAGGWLVMGASACLAVVWVSTFTLQVPLHATLAAGFDIAVHRRLVSTNWIRTAFWTFRTGLLVSAMMNPAAVS